MALRTYLQCKLHRGTVTGADLEYEGSISICRQLLRCAGLHVHERVEVYNVTNGERFATYVIPGEAEEIGVNGAAAHKASPGDQVIIAAYVQLTPEEAAGHSPDVVLLGDENSVVRIQKGSGPCVAS